ncbi:DNA methyltransferase [Lamprobacter modestohalophilus]|uniref:DNA methyltransferase n=1 Tax=Lamprobacter modestohalophilus TaxID=1064514 RepID=UPI002ADEE099|nr:DNA methyltransferase [Lamprobacter modestohalophilus]MEA1053363.1 DNA methyltransferase [Lamprobacter modestohalophilus]
MAPARVHLHFNRQARKPNKPIGPRKTAGQNTICADGSGDDLGNADGRNPAWTHFDRATQDRRIPDSLVITVMRQRGSIGEGIDHPAVFPIGLPRFVMEAFTDPGEQVLEPFSGSGTSILAAEQCGRQARAIEVAPEYVVPTSPSSAGSSITQSVSRC